MKLQATALIPLFVLLTACGTGIANSASGTLGESQGSQLSFVTEQPTHADADVVIQNASVQNNDLVLRIAYSGGCQPHTFALDVWHGFLESYPVQTYATFKETSPTEDDCKAIVREEVRISLQPLVDHYRNSYQQSSGTVVLRLSGYGNVTVTF